MTRCVLLDQWFDTESEKLDKKESKSKKCFVTGRRKGLGLKSSKPPPSNRVQPTLESSHA